MKFKNNLYVCISYVNNNILTAEFNTSSEEEAKELFLNKYNVNTQIVLGPYYKKKKNKKSNNFINKDDIVLTNVIKPAIYDDWFVNAFILQQPKDYALLLFKNKINGEKANKPKGKIIVKIDELKIQE